MLKSLVELQASAQLLQGLWRAANAVGQRSLLSVNERQGQGEAKRDHRSKGSQYSHGGIILEVSVELPQAAAGHLVQQIG